MADDDYEESEEISMDEDYAEEYQEEVSEEPEEVGSELSMDEQPEDAEQNSAPGEGGETINMDGEDIGDLNAQNPQNAAVGDSYSQVAGGGFSRAAHRPARRVSSGMSTGQKMAAGAAGLAGAGLVGSALSGVAQGAQALAGGDPDSLVQVTEVGLGERLVESLKGVLVGLALFFGSFALLYWNEGNVIAEKESLDQLNKAMVTANAKAPKAANNDKPIHATAKLDTPDKLGDSFIKAGNYLKLSRDVEMYQWVEESQTKSKKSVGGKETKTTTYSYKMKWKSGRVNSDNFKKQKGHINPALPVDSKSVSARKVSFGKFDGKPVLERAGSGESLSLTSSMLKKKLPVAEGKVYARGNPSSPKLGDVRISYTVLKPQVFSIIAKQDSVKTLDEYQTANGRSQFLVEAGKKSPKQMIQTAKETAGMIAMILRVVGFALMWIGLTLFLSPFSTLMDVIPFLGSVSRFVINVASFVVAAVLSTVTILVSMVVHNPIALAVVVIGALGGIGYFVKNRVDSKKRKNPGQGGQQAVSPPEQRNAA